MKNSVNTKPSLALSSLLCLLLATSNVSAMDLSPQIELSNQLVVRGFSYTRNQPTLQASISYDLTDDFFVGAGGFTSSSTEDNGIYRGVNAYLGWFHTINDQSAVQVSIEHNQFFGDRQIIWPYTALFEQYQTISDTASTWSYTELRGDYYFSRNSSLSLIYSDDYLGRLTGAVILEGNWNKELSDRFSVKSKTGYIRAGENQLLEKVVYASSGLHVSFDSPWGAHVTAHYGNSRLDRIVGEDAAGTSIVFGLSYQF